ncbi:hypothetical protein SVIOM342S_10542 [Streptomyces violaceorubidus]
METATGFGGAEGDSGHARGLALLLELTEALCALSCTEDPQGRGQFAAVLGDQLGRPVDLRGVKQREDVVTLVRTALNVAGGERVLVAVVRILEGPLAGDELDRVITPDPPAGPDAPPGPLGSDDEAAARAVLARGELPAGRLRDDLAEELNGLDLPAGLLPEQLFLHVLAWNTQPDGLPPAVLLLDRAAPLAATPGHRAALTDWVDDWVKRVGLPRELERRREARTCRWSCAPPAVSSCSPWWKDTWGSGPRGPSAWWTSSSAGSGPTGTHSLDQLLNAVQMTTAGGFQAHGDGRKLVEMLLRDLAKGR